MKNQIPIKIKTNEAAKLVSVHPNTIRKLAKKGAIKKHTISKTLVLYDRDEILKYFSK